MATARVFFSQESRVGEAGGQVRGPLNARTFKQLASPEIFRKGVSVNATLKPAVQRQLGLGLVIRCAGESWIPKRPNIGTCYR